MQLDYSDRVSNSTSAAAAKGLLGQFSCGTARSGGSKQKLSNLPTTAIITTQRSEGIPQKRWQKKRNKNDATGRTTAGDECAYLDWEAATALYTYSGRKHITPVENHA